MTKSKTTIYETITNRVIAGLKKDGLKWFRPWEGGHNSPMNHSSEAYYKGFNVLWLNSICAEHGYTDNEWLTYKQGEALGVTLKKGSTASDKNQFVVYWMVSYTHKVTKKYYANETALKKAGVSKSECNEYWSMRYYTVFNISQFENCPPKRVKSEGETFEPIVEAEKILAEYKGQPSLRHGGEMAYYQPANHHVQMPEKDAFVTPDDYYKTLFHELTHSTGHETLLKRKGIADMQGFNSDSYSQEELVAELGSEYLVGITGINPKDNEANAQAYINGWINKLQNDDPKLIIYASQQAMKAVELITKK
jgi:antirestriction protein ArdC